MPSERWIAQWNTSGSSRYASASSHDARVLYWHLQHFVDAWGRAKVDIAEIWQKCWALLGQIEQVPELMDQLDACGLIALYRVNGQEYFAIYAWEEHAGKYIRINRRAPSRHPPPPEPTEDSGTGPGPVRDQSRLRVDRELTPPLSPPARGGAFESSPAASPASNGRAPGHEDAPRSARRRRDQPPGPREPQEWRHLLPDFPALATPAFAAAMDEYMAHRAEHERGSAYTKPALRRQFAELASFGADEATALIVRVVRANWVRLRDHDAGAQKRNGQARNGSNGGGQRDGASYRSAAELRQLEDVGPPPEPGTLMRLFEAELDRVRTERRLARAGDVTRTEP